MAYLEELPIVSYNRAMAGEIDLTQAGTMRSRFATVLFADVVGSTKLYETHGDAVAHRTIDACVAVMRRATEAAGGRVVKTIGDEVMSVFAEADAAARAAVSMHVGINAMPPMGGLRLMIRIGFQGGPVLQKESDVFGDTVNLAARLTEQAAGGQIITSRETAGTLTGEWRLMARDLYGVKVRGKVEEVELAELLWKVDENSTVMLRGSAPRPKAPGAVLRLKYRTREIRMRRENDSLVIGREADCGIVVADNMASRRHCTIERRQDKFVLKDHSTNGSFVTNEGDAELLLRREEVTLLKHGWIAFGPPRAGTQELVEFFLES